MRSLFLWFVCGLRYITPLAGTGDIDGRSGLGAIPHSSLMLCYADGVAEANELTNLHELTDAGNGHIRQLIQSLPVVTRR